MSNLELLELDITTSEKDDAGELRGNVGDGVTGVGWGQQFGFWAPEGFYGAPNEKDKDGAARALILREGQQSYVIGFKDNRIVARYAEMAPGDRAIITRSGAAVFLKEDGKSVTLSYNAGDGSPTLVAQLDGDAKAWKVAIADDAGASWFTQSPSKIYMGVNGGGALKIDKAGVHINGNLCEVNCGMVTLGMTAPSTPLVPGVNSAIIGATGMTGVASSKVLIAGP